RVDHSVTGRLIGSQPDLLTVDPQTDPLYRPYLGQRMRSELALRIPLDASVTAILNMETEQEAAFRELHADAIRMAARHLAPILSGLYWRRDRTRRLQRAQLYALDRYLERVTEAFAHDMSGPLSNARLLTDSLPSMVADDSPVHTVVTKLRDRIAAA